MFYISENNHENTETYSDDESETNNIYDAKGKKKEVIERNLLERKKTMKTINIPRDSRNGYKLKFKGKKTTHRIKKLGNNFSDFII